MKWSPDHPDRDSSPLRSVRPAPECSSVLTRQVTVSAGDPRLIDSLFITFQLRITVAIITAAKLRAIEITEVEQAKVSFNESKVNDYLLNED